MFRPPGRRVENEVNTFCFTLLDPTTRQAEELKKNNDIKKMPANVRPNCRLSGY
jgi:hypothetical protein